MTSAIVLFVEQFSVDRRNTKTKVNQRKFKLKTGENLKRGKTRVTRSPLVLILRLIVLKDNGSFPDQSQRQVKQK